MPVKLVRFACASCGQHISATCGQIGVTAPCPNCNVAVTVPKISTLPLPQTVPISWHRKKRYQTTVILIDDSAATPDKPKKLTKWTNRFTEALDWLTVQLDAVRGAQYVAKIFDHQQKKSVFKENRQGG
jgi:hypothetical protein